MTKSDLIAAVQERSHLDKKDVGLAVHSLLDLMTQTLAQNGRIEVRGFGSFSLHRYPPRIGRNPATGEPVAVEARCVPRFRPGKELRARIQVGQTR